MLSHISRLSYNVHSFHSHLVWGGESDGVTSPEKTNALKICLGSGRSNPSLLAPVNHQQICQGMAFSCAVPHITQ